MVAGVPDHERCVVIPAISPASTNSNRSAEALLLQHGSDVPLPENTHLLRWLATSSKIYIAADFMAA